MGKKNKREVYLLSIVLVTFFIVLVVAAPSFHTSETNSYLVEDQSPLFSYNFTSNVTNAAGDNLTFSIEEIHSDSSDQTTPSSYSWITINSSTGVMTINSSRDNETGNLNISVKVLNDVPTGQVDVFYFHINKSNDAPFFSNLVNQTFNVSALFDYTINISDEEDNTPFSINISFLSCGLAEWSNRGSNCTLFSDSNYVFDPNAGTINLSFTPTRNDVGSYVINFSVTDLNNNNTPYNRSTSTITNFTVLNVNAAPYFTYTCNNERNATEDIAFTCYINASDIDEVNNLTYSSNLTWFLNNNASATNLTTSYNSSATVNFTPSDINVGNWSINVSVRDTGSPAKTNSTIIWFYVENKNDSVSILNVSNLTAYQGSSYNILINASDDDLLIPAGPVYSESLTFSIKNLSGSTIPWITIVAGSVSGNSYTSYLEFEANSSTVGFYDLNLSVVDANSFSSSSTLFSINVSANNVPLWTNFNSSYFLNETIEFYINLTDYVNDSDGDSFTFYYHNLSYFPSFSLASSTGIINFTPKDQDVGFYQVYLNVSDSKAHNQTLVSFNITNLNDIPIIKTPLSTSNATRDSNSNIVATEDNFTVVTLWVQDDDYMIQDSQKIYYNESISINLTIQGNNLTILNFYQDSDFPSTLFPNLTKFIANFTPSKSDVGFYNVTINASDINNASSILYFNLTINSVSHVPSLVSLDNQTSAVNRTLYYRFNATDTEDGSSNNNSNTNFTFSYLFVSGSTIFNDTVFNITSGVLNITFNDTMGGKYNINITVNDSSNSQDIKSFWLYVYDVPSITFPSTTEMFNLTENNLSSLIFITNHSVGDNLTYLFYLDNIYYTNSTDFNYTDKFLRYNITYYGNSTNLTWSFRPNFTDETYGKYKNLTLMVYPSSTSLENAEVLNKTIVWKVNITHFNSNVSFNNHVGDSQSTYSSPIEIDLSDYFSDIDHDDPYYNQSLNFSVQSNSTTTGISYGVSSDWTLSLSASSAVTELLTITGNDSLSINISNQFQITFTTPATTTVTSSSGGGGGSTGTPISLKIIIPDPVSAFKKDRLVLPITLKNSGKTSLSGISLSGTVAKNGSLTRDISLSFDKSNFDYLRAGEEVSTTLIANVNTEEVGLFEITLNANVTTPKYSDWGKLYLTVKESDKIVEKLLFTEEFIVQNPQCIELKELVDELKEDYKNGETQLILQKSEDIINSCKKAIAQQNSNPLLKITLEDKIYRYLTIFTLVVFFCGLFYYSYKRMKLRRSQFDYNYVK